MVATQSVLLRCAAARGHYKNGKHYVYNCGSKKSVNNPGPTVTGHAAYTDVWRPGEGGSTSASIENGATTSEASADTGSKFDKLTLLNMIFAL